MNRAGWRFIFLIHISSVRTLTLWTVFVKVLFLKNGQWFLLFSWKTLLKTLCLNQVMAACWPIFNMKNHLNEFGMFCSNVLKKWTPSFELIFLGPKKKCLHNVYKKGLFGLRWLESVMSPPQWEGMVTARGSRERTSSNASTEQSELSDSILQVPALQQSSTS